MSAIESFLLCLIVAVLAALVLAIIEQRNAFRRGYELGHRTGFREGRTSEREEVAAVTRSEVVYPPGRCTHGRPMWAMCAECGAAEADRR